MANNFPEFKKSMSLQNKDAYQILNKINKSKSEEHTHTYTHTKSQRKAERKGILPQRN